MYGGTDTETRERFVSITENEKDAIIIASYGTFRTGINIRNIIISCSQVHQRVEYEFSNQSGEDYDKVKTKDPLNCLICQIDSISQGTPKLHTKTLLRKTKYI